jgi:hypothetical protein
MLPQTHRPIIFRNIVCVTQAEQVYKTPWLAHAMKTPFSFFTDIYAAAHAATKHVPKRCMCHTGGTGA